jgi:hypothetical protein
VCKLFSFHSPQFLSDVEYANESRMGIKFQRYIAKKQEREDRENIDDYIYIEFASKKEEKS